MNLETFSFHLKNLSPDLVFQKNLSHIKLSSCQLSFLFHNLRFNGLIIPA